MDFENPQTGNHIGENISRIVLYNTNFPILSYEILIS